MKILLPLAENRKLEEVPQSVFNIRDMIVNSDGSPRYVPGHVVQNDDSSILIELEGVTVKDLEIVAKYCGVETKYGTTSCVLTAPQFLYIRGRTKNAKLQVIDTATGNKFKPA